MFITLCNQFERRIDERGTEQIKQKMTKTWFNAMLQQVQTARHDIASNNKFYGYQPNGKIFPAFDIHRHGLAAAYLLNNQSKRNMFTKSDQAGTFATLDKSTENVKSITDGMSDVTIVKKEYWKPSLRPRPVRKASTEDKGSSFPSSDIVRSRKPQIDDRLEEQKATAEMELTAKSCIESCAEFKLLFVPGYELDCPEQYYEDPVSSGSSGCSTRRSSEASQDPFKSRLFSLGKLEDETAVNEDRQKRFDTWFCVSKYNGAYKERRLMNDRRMQSSGFSQNTGSLTERSAPNKSRPTPRTSGRRSKVQTGAKQFNSVEDIFSSARSSSQNLMSQCQELNFGCDMTSSEDTDSLQDNELKPKGGVEQNKKPVRNASRRKSKCNASSDLKPSKFYDVKEIATTYTVPCGEKMTEAAKKKNKNSAPGKSFFSQRKNSLTSKQVCRRPATAVVRKKKPHTQKRPNTAIVDTRSSSRKLED